MYKRTDVEYEANSLSTKNVRVFVEENGMQLFGCMMVLIMSWNGRDP
jgi:hypothetical protein